MRRRLLHVALTLLVVASLTVPALSYDRIWWIPGINPPSNWLNQGQRSARLAFGELISTDLGGSRYGGNPTVWPDPLYNTNNGFFTNLIVYPAGGMTVKVLPGSYQSFPDGDSFGEVYMQGTDDIAPFGTGVTALPADNGSTILQGMVGQAGYPSQLATGTITAPGSNSTSYLTECKPSGLTVAPVLNNSSTQNFVSGTGTVTTATAYRDAQDQIICFNKVGTTSASPPIPAPDSGYVAIGGIVVPSGTVTLTTAMMSPYASQPWPGFAAYDLTANLPISGHVNQQAACTQFACRHAMVSGSYTFTYGKAFTSTPVCVASTEGTTYAVHVTVNTSACVVTSSNGSDTSTVDIVVVGNPN